VIPAGLAALRASPRARAVALLIAAGGAALIALAPGDLGPAAARAGLVVAGLAGAAALARARRRTATPPALAILSRAPLARDAGIALIEVEGRRILLGYGAGGVNVLAPAGAPEGDRP
jgi:flagellar protein FliO/FliZ